MRTVSIIIAITFTCACCIQKKNEKWNSLNSFERAKQILDSAIVSMGGVERLRSIEQVTIDYDGVRHMINQSRKPDAPWDTEPNIGKVHVDRKNDRIYTDNASFYPGIGSYAGAVRLVGIKGFGIDFQKNYHGTEAWDISGESNRTSQWSSCSRWIPPLLALQAIDNKTSLRFLGAKSFGGKTLNAINFVQPNKTYLVLLFEEDRNILVGYETIRSDDVYGDVIETILYSEFKYLDGVQIPGKRTEYFNNQVARELSFKTSINVPMKDSDFDLPDGFTMPVESNELYLRIKKIADGVYMDQDMGGVLIVEFDDYCVVLDCPGDFQSSQSTMDAIREILPSKPVKFVATSHTHGDHGGGVRAYYHSGATIITTPGHLNFYKKIAKIHQSIDPDPLFYSNKEPIIETFKDKKVITDGSQTLELYNIGKNLHTDEMTIAWLPKQKIIWQADQFFVPFTGHHLNEAMPITIEFAKKLEHLNLINFDYIIDPHFPKVSTKKDFMETLGKAYEKHSH